MKIFISILFVFFSISTFGQTLPNTDMFDLYTYANKLLKEAKYEEAIKHLESYHERYPRNKLMDDRINNIKSAKRSIDEATRLLNSGNNVDYEKAINKFLEYRKVLPDVRIDKVESRILLCNRRIIEKLLNAKIRGLEERNAEQLKTILAYENNLQGDEAIRRGEFDLAKDFYTISLENAIPNEKLHQTVQAKLREVDRLNNLLTDYNNAKADDERLTILEKYRNGIFIINDFENKINILEVAMASISKQNSVEYTLLELAKSCKVNAVLAYAETLPNQKNFDNDQLKSYLTILVRELDEIEKIKTFGDSEQKREFVRDGYKSILNRKIFNGMPIVWPIIKICIQSKYCEYLTDQSQFIMATGLDKTKALEYINMAIENATNDAQEAKAKGLLARLKEGNCDIISGKLKEYLFNGNASINRCDLITAQRQVTGATTILSGCERFYEAEQKELQAIKQRIETMKSDSINLPEWRTKAKTSLKNNECEEARKYYNKIHNISNCNPALINEIYETGTTLCDACDKEKSKTSGGITVNEKTKTTSTNLNFLYGFELSIGAAWVLPLSIKGDKIKFSALTNPEISLQYVFINPKKKADYYIGSGYVKNAFYTYGDTKSNRLEAFDIDLIRFNAGIKLRKANAESKPFLKLGASYSIPFKTRYYNYNSKDTYTNSLINNFFSVYLGAGYEWKMKRTVLGIEPYFTAAINYFNSTPELSGVTSSGFSFSSVANYGIKANFRLSKNEK